MYAFKRRGNSYFWHCLRYLVVSEDVLAFSMGGNVLIPFKADFQSVQFSERAEILLFTGENIALKFNRQLWLSNFLLSKIPPARKILLTGNWALEVITRNMREKPPSKINRKENEKEANL